MLRDAMKKKEDSSAWSPDSPVHNFATKMESQVQVLQEELDKARETEAELLSDREASVRALHQTIEATRELSARHAEEKAKRGEVEAKLATAEARSVRAENRILALMEVSPASAAAKGGAEKVEEVATAGGGGGDADEIEEEIFIDEHGNKHHRRHHHHHRHHDHHHSVPSATKEVSFVDEKEIFSPPLPPPQAQAQAQAGGVGATSSANSNNPLRDSTSSLLSDTSTASSVADELARLRAELQLIEQSKPN